MIKVGITGAIGSGKSMVAHLFRVLGAPVYDADTAAKQLMTTNAALREQLIGHFGKETYLADGSLNRTYLAGKVFTNPENLSLLNSLVHPVVRDHSTQWMAQHEGYPYAIKEAALLLESGSYEQLDVLICVTAPEQLRIARVMARDNTTEDAVRLRMAQQWTQEQKAAACGHIIVNDDNTPIIPQVWALHALLML